jgi:hypothetical protein
MARSLAEEQRYQEFRYQLGVCCEWSFYYFVFLAYLASAVYLQYRVAVLWEEFRVCQEAHTEGESCETRDWVGGKQVGVMLYSIPLYGVVLCYAPCWIGGFMACVHRAVTDCLASCCFWWCVERHISRELTPPLHTTPPPPPLQVTQMSSSAPPPPAAVAVVVERALGEEGRGGGRGGD